MPHRFFRGGRPAVLLAALLVLAHAGCGGASSPSDEAKSDGQAAADQKKIQELSKKGYDFKDIRSIMKGEEPEPKAKKKASHGRR